jgi:hypothetical protein
MVLPIRHCPLFVNLGFEHIVLQRYEVDEYIYNYTHYALDIWSGKMHSVVI